MQVLTCLRFPLSQCGAGGGGAGMRRSTRRLLLSVHLQLPTKSTSPLSSSLCKPTAASSSRHHRLLLPRSAAIFSLPLSFTPRPMAAEEDVGILCYANSVPGFQGILKQRYSDFIVNEVDLDGNVVHLTHLQPPAEISEVEGDVVGQDVAPTAAAASHQEAGSSVFLEEFRGLAGDSDAQLFKNMVDKVDAGQLDDLSPLILAPDYDKAHRTVIHNFFKTRLPSFVTDAVDGPDQTSKCIRIRYQVKGCGGGGKRQGKYSRDGGDRKRLKEEQPFDKRGVDSWPADREKHLQFHLYKENKDTQDALSVIGRMLGLQSKSFGFAGTKDKRAVTTQRVTVFKQTAKKVAALNERLYGIRVGNFSYVKEGLVLGQLSGNQFTISLRGVVAKNDDAVLQAAEGLHKSGFINYFGLQRFGSGSITTHSVGAALLRGEWKAAVQLILSPRDGEPPEIADARSHYEKTKDIDGALTRMPRYLVPERSILSSLKKSPGNFLLAITSIPRPMRLLYVHSYQSFLWNHAASVRAEKYGVDRVVEGDIVYCDEVDTSKVCDTPKDTTDQEANGLDADATAVLSEMDVVHDNHQRRTARLVTAEDVMLGRYSISDVLLPLPGSMLLYPSHEAGNVYEELAAKDRLDLKSSKHNVKEFSITSLTGGYRQFLQKPRDLQWKLLKYTDSTVPLAETDWDRVLKKNNNLGACCTSKGVEDVASSLNQQTALQLSFTLPSSCYATMLVRELLKTSTSVSFHKSLNPVQAD